MQAYAEAERSGRPFLVFRDREGRERLFVFQSDAATPSVGRSPTSDVVLDWDNQVSRTHARFERGAEGWAVIDDGSSNGTFVNEQRVSGKSQLNAGDQIRFGSTVARFHAPQQPTPSPPAPQSPRPPAIDLSSTQRRVLIALCRPYKGTQPYAIPATDEAIAEELVLGAGEVRGHLRVLGAKLGIGPLPDAELRVRLVQAAFAAGLISQQDL